MNATPTATSPSSSQSLAISHAPHWAFGDENQAAHERAEAAESIPPGTPLWAAAPGCYQCSSSRISTVADIRNTCR